MVLIVSIHRSMTMHYMLLPKCTLNKAFQGQLAQQHRSNVPAANCTGVLQASVDYLHAGLHHCWDGREISTWIISHCLPDHAFATIKTGSKWGDLNTSANIADFVSLYGDDLPPPASLDTELHCWSVKWQGHSSESQSAASLHSPAKALATIDSDFSQMFSSSRLLVHWL